MWVDLLAQRGMLIGWGGVLLAQAVLFVAGPSGRPASPVPVNLDFSIMVVRFCWTIVVAALFVQSDSLVGTTAFWMTRPIPRPVLLIAKVLSTVVWFVAMPIVVMAGALLWLGMSPLDALIGGGLVGQEQAVILAMAVMAALVTVNVGQLVVAGIAGVTLVAAFNGLLLPVLTLTWPSVGSSLAGWQPTVYITTVIAGALLVTAYHYFTLRAWRSLVLIASTMFAATALTRLWPAPPLVPDIGPVPETVMSASAVTLNASSRAPRIEDIARWIMGKHDRLWRIQFETTSTGHPPNIYLWPIVARTEITFPTLTPLQWSGPTALTPIERAVGDRTEGQPWRSIQLALGDVALETPHLWKYFTPVADVSDADFRARSSVPGQLKAEITMLAYRYEITASAPLQAGAAFRRSRRAGRIVSVTSLNPGARIELRETMLEGAPPLAKGDFGISWYVLRNKARRQAVLLQWRANEPFTASVGITATWVHATRGLLEVDSPETGALFTVDAAWLEGAELVLVEPKALGVLTRPLVIDNVMLGGGPTQSPVPSPQPLAGAVR